MPKTATPEEKLKELIIYISTKCSSDAKYGKVKLNKILFFSDFLYYQKKQIAITGVKYRHLPFGPVPDDIDKLIKRMSKTGNDVTVAYINTGVYTQPMQKLVAQREADLSLFEPDMIAQVDSIIEDVCGGRSVSGTQLSELTHTQIMGYRTTSQGQEIPITTTFIKNKSHQVATEWEKLRARELAIEFAGQYGYPALT